MCQNKRTLKITFTIGSLTFNKLRSERIQLVRSSEKPALKHRIYYFFTNPLITHMGQLSYLKSMYSPVLDWLVSTGRSYSDDRTSCSTTRASIGFSHHPRLPAMHSTQWKHHTSIAMAVVRPCYITVYELSFHPKWNTWSTGGMMETVKSRTHLVSVHMNTCWLRHIV